MLENESAIGSVGTAGWIIARGCAAARTGHRASACPLFVFDFLFGLGLACSGLRIEMVSIGKLAGGQGDYYLEQAKTRVDRVLSVSSGVEDYYFDGSDPDGVWVGSGAAALGVNRSVKATEFRRLLDGCHPATGERLGRLAAKRVPGFDLTFSAPKSVSVLFGVGDPALRDVIREAHEAAVRDALGYLEREAAVARRGPGGIVSVPGRGFVGAAFRHRASRAGDPQLHTHVVIANLVQAEDGRWSALDGRRIYAHAKSAGYLYEARLRAELTRT